MPEPYHMRRTDREITDPAHVERILAAGRYATFALVDRGAPYVVTLSYGYDCEHGRLYFHVAHEGHKLDVIARDPEACGTVVLDGGYTHGECEHPYESVVMRGSMRVVTDDAEKLHAIHTLVGHLERDPQAYWDSRGWQLEQRLSGFSAVCFEIRSVTAKQGS